MEFDFVSKMREKIDPETIKELHGSYVFKVVGLGEYGFSIDQDGPKLLDELPADPTFKLITDKETWDGITSGLIQPQMAFMSGKLSIEGDLSLAAKIGSLL